jgi:fucose 4-O-acetylase-like acetyltransferase
VQTHRARLEAEVAIRPVRLQLVVNPALEGLAEELRPGLEAAAPRQVIYHAHVGEVELGSLDHAAFGSFHVRWQEATDQAVEGWIDLARGMGITLVVYGHTVRGLFGAGVVERAGAWSLVDHFIYGFHMPLFFLLAGLFMQPREDESLLQLVRRHLVRFGYPYLIWASAQMALQIAASSHTNSSVTIEDFPTIFVTPPMQFWFLYALFVQAIWLDILDKLRVSRSASVLIALVLFASGPWVPIGRWGVLCQARHDLLFTALGMRIGATALSSLVRRAPLALVAAAGYAIVGVWAVAGYKQYLLAFLVGVAGTAATLCVAAAWSASGHAVLRSVSWLVAELGRASLGIFVAHTIISAGARIVLQKMLGIEDPSAHVLVGTLLGLFVPMVLVRLRIPYLFEWPRSRRSATTTAPVEEPSAQPRWRSSVCISVWHRRSCVVIRLGALLRRWRRAGRA